MTREPLGEIAAHYPYTDENGRLLYEVLRFKPKAFRPRRPDGKWTLEGVRQVLYHLPDVVEAIAEGRWIYVVEGEKDAENLAARDLCATTNFGGAKKWRPEYTATLRGAKVAILPDNDPAGREHADVVARALRGTAAEIRILDLPGLPEKGDV
ncbi:MAG: hypothetical protein M3P51_08865, partial [Chloroflexota bacterium]|nr:hypothetical protein [Chloroflexota bacterium]